MAVSVVRCAMIYLMKCAAYLQRARDLLMRQRTMILNAIRGHLAEFGIIAAQGPRQVMGMIAQLRDDGDASLPEIARSALLALGDHL